MTIGVEEMSVLEQNLFGLTLHLSSIRERLDLNRFRLLPFQLPPSPPTALLFPAPPYLHRVLLPPPPLTSLAR